jgi:hypothetical protein
VLLTRLPLGIATSFDLHVLGTPPALVLSQDQTLHKKFYGALEKWLSNFARSFIIVRETIHSSINGVDPFAGERAKKCTFSRLKDIAKLTLS